MKPSPKVVVCLLHLLLGILALTPAHASQSIVVDYSDTWRWNIPSSDPGTGWRNLGFNDASWGTGAGLLGFETAVLPQPGLQTRVGAAATAPFTYLFRKTFTYSGSTSGLNYTIDQVVDDGVSYYLNGNLLGSVRHTPGAWNNNASAAVGDAVEECSALNGTPTGLVNGVNVLTAEVHQVATNGSDLVFGARLTLFAPESLDTATWRTQNFGSSANTGSGADLFDYDGDGLVNMAEFALNTDPKKPSSAWNSHQIEGANLAFTYSRRKSAMSEFSFACQWAASANGTWSSTGVTELVIADNGTFQTVKATVALSGAAKKFFRVNLIKTPTPTGPVRTRKLYSTILGFSSDDVPNVLNFETQMVAAGINGLRFCILPKEWIAGNRHYDQLTNFATQNQLWLAFMLPHYYYRWELPSWLPVEKCQKFSDGTYHDVTLTPSFAYITEWVKMKNGQPNTYGPGNPFWHYEHEFIDPLLARYGGILNAASTGSQATMELGYGVKFDSNGVFVAVAGYDDMAIADFRNWLMETYGSLANINAATNHNYSQLSDINPPTITNSWESFGGNLGKAWVAFRSKRVQQVQQHFRECVQSRRPNVEVVCDVGQTVSNQGIAYATQNIVSISTGDQILKENLAEYDDWAMKDCDRIRSWAPGGRAHAEADGSHYNATNHTFGGLTRGEFVPKLVGWYQRGGEGISLFSYTNAGNDIFQLVRDLTAQINVNAPVTTVYPTGVADVHADSLRSGNGNDFYTNWNAAGGNQHPVNVVLHEIQAPALP